MLPLRNRIKLHEGLRLEPYLCPTGAWTIGYGYKIRKHEKFTRLTIDQAERLLDLGLARFRGFKRMISAIDRGDWQQAAAELEDSKWYRQVGPSRGDTLVDLLRED